MLDLFIIFFYVGLFTIGGGLVAIPLIQESVVSRGWITVETFYQMVAIAESTPGPIGINVATYVGLIREGFLGAIVATFGFALPSFLIVVFFAKFYLSHKNSPWLKWVFYFLKAGIIGLIAVALGTVAKTVFLNPTSFLGIDWTSVTLFIALGLFYFTLKKHPIFTLLLAGVLGVIFL